MFISANSPKMLLSFTAQRLRKGALKTKSVGVWTCLLSPLHPPVQLNGMRTKTWCSVIHAQNYHVTYHFGPPRVLKRTRVPIRKTLVLQEKE